MMTLQEKIKSKKEIIEYLNEMIDKYSHNLNFYREYKKDELKSGIRTNLLAVGGLSVSLFISYIALNTPFSLPILIVLTPFMTVSLLGLPISICMNMETQREIRKTIRETTKKINTAVLREEYEKEILQELEDDLKYCNNINQSQNEGDSFDRAKSLINKEIETFAFNTHKIINARKSGKLKQFLSDRYNVGDEEAIKMYESMVDLYTNNAYQKKTLIVPKSKKLVRK